jgi:hypothetical protein
MVEGVLDTYTFFDLIFKGPRCNLQYILYVFPASSFFSALLTSSSYTLLLLNAKKDLPQTFHLSSYFINSSLFFPLHPFIVPFSDQPVIPLQICNFSPSLPLPHLILSCNQYLFLMLSHYFTISFFLCIDISLSHSLINHYLNRSFSLFATAPHLQINTYFSMS